MAKRTKNFARQTAASTEVIENKISAVQALADTVIKNSVRKTIVEEIEQLVVSIVSTNEGQTTVVRKLTGAKTAKFLGTVKARLVSSATENPTKSSFENKKGATQIAPFLYHFKTVV